MLQCKGAKGADQGGARTGTCARASLASPAPPRLLPIFIKESVTYVCCQRNRYKNSLDKKINIRNVVSAYSKASIKLPGSLCDQAFHD